MTGGSSLSLHAVMLEFINTLRRAQEVSGTKKIYALVGGFHLAPAPDDYLQQVMAELEKFDLEHVLPMH